MTIVHGVAFLLFEPFGHLLVLRELINKPHDAERVNTLSFPMETIESGEAPDQTIIRLIHEEIGVAIARPPIFFKEINVQISDIFFVTEYLFLGTCDKAFVAQPNDSDVEFFGWLTPEELLAQHVRREVVPILREYMQWKTRAVF